MQFKLPDSIYSSSQLRQLQSELKRLSGLRNPKNISFGANLQELSLANGIKKINMTIVTQMLRFVNSQLTHSTEITMALASTPSIEERNELVADLRRMIDKSLLVHFVVQPELLAGATIRTKTNFYDMSLRSALFGNKQKLMQEIRNA